MKTPPNDFARILNRGIEGASYISAFNSNRGEGLTGIVASARRIEPRLYQRGVSSRFRLPAGGFRQTLEAAVAQTGIAPSSYTPNPDPAEPSRRAMTNPGSQPLPTG